MVTSDWWIDLVLIAILAAVLIVYSVLAGRRERRLQLGSARNGQPAPEPRRSLKGVYGALIRQAGFRGSAVWAGLWGWKVFLAALYPLIRIEFLSAFGIEQTLTFTTLYLAVLGFFTPELWLWRRRRVRRRRIRAALSYFLDLTVALLRSSLSLERALLRAADEGFSEKHPLADEVGVLGRELELGKERTTAFSALAERTGVGELRIIGAAIRMGMKLGSPIEQALETQADAVRSQLRERSIRRVNAVTVMALIPVFLCGVPVFAVIIYFPAFLRIIETLRMFRAY